MRRIGVPERRARLGWRHRLAGGAQASDPVGVARSLVAVHSTDPSSVYLSLLARMTGGGLGDVQRALYEDKTLIRLLGMRRTVFVTALDIAPVIQAACSRAVAASERRKLLGRLADSGVGDDVEGWLAGAEQAALSALAARGEATAAELATDDPRLQVQITLARGKPYEGTQNVASRVLFLLAAQGQVVRGRPRGSWTSHQYRWAPLAPWCPQGLDGWTTEAAEVELARRWLEAYGPATADDLRWWAGWTKTQVRRALTELKPAEVDLDGVPGIVLAGDLEPAAGGGTVGGAAAGAGLHAHGLAAAGVVPRGARRPAVRPDRQRRPDPVVGRPDRRRLGAGPRRADRLPVPGRRRRRRGGGGRRRRGAAGWHPGRRPADRPHPRHDLAGAGTKQLTNATARVHPRSREDATHPGKIKNMKDKKHRSRDKGIVVLTARMTVESASRNTQVQAASNTGGSSVPPGKCQHRCPWKVQAVQVQARAPYSSGFQRSGGVTTMPTPGTVTT